MRILLVVTVVLLPALAAAQPPGNGKTMRG
jgi:hypothetical protein